MMRGNDFRQDAYDAAYCQLSDAYFNGDIGPTAETIVDELQAAQTQHGLRHIESLAESITSRQATVHAIVPRALGDSATALAAVDSAVAAAAFALQNTKLGHTTPSR